MMSGARERPPSPPSRTKAQISRWSLRISHRLTETWDHLRILEPAARMEKEESEYSMGNWPRRLLHVPMMTSYEWKPGNWYGPRQIPIYNALSCTWGRWILRDNEMPEVDPVAVKGVPWKTPRVHSSVPVIRTAALDRRPRVPRGKSVDFVWLDIACIDQKTLEPATPVSTGVAEVGRQAKIFRNAAKVSVWLTELTQEHLKTIRETLREASQGMDGWRGDSRDGDNLPLESHSVLKSLFAGPWFSSLW